jgi:hypothetical protein
MIAALTTATGYTFLDADAGEEVDHPTCATLGISPDMTLKIRVFSGQGMPGCKDIAGEILDRLTAPLKFRASGLDGKTAAYAVTTRFMRAQAKRGEADYASYIELDLAFDMETTTGLRTRAAVAA